MSSSREVSTQLLEGLEDGTFNPTHLRDCADTLEVDANVDTIGYEKLVFLAHPQNLDFTDQRIVDAPLYRILPSRPLSPDERREAIEEIADSIIEYYLPTGRAVRDEEMPSATNARDNSNVARRVLEQALVLAGTDVPAAITERTTSAVRIRPDISDDEIAAVYQLWLEERLTNEGWALGMILGPRAEGVSAVISRQDLIDQIERVLFPDYATVSEPYPFVAFHFDFEQVWERLGYTRGELVTSLGLAPGEQVTLEYHTWESTELARQEEEELEREQQFDRTLGVRHTVDIKREIARAGKLKLGAEYKPKLSVPVGKVPLTIGGVGPEAEVTTGLEREVNNANELSLDYSVEAAESLRSLRRVQIDVTSERGVDNKRTRVVANTNRCHTLNVSYFEVCANYRVCSHLRRVVPCILVPFTPEKPSSITKEWVLQHEHVLRQALLDRSLERGLQATRLLLEYKEYESALQESQSASPPSAQGQMSQSAPTARRAGRDANTENDLAGYIEEVLASYAVLRESSGRVERAIQRAIPAALAGLLGGVSAAAAFAARSFVAGIGADSSEVGRAIYFGQIQSNSDIVAVIRKFRAYQEGELGGDGSALKAVRDAYAIVHPRDFVMTTIPALLSESLESLGVPPQASTLVGAMLTGFGTMSVLPDAGMRAAVTALWDYYSQLIASDDQQRLSETIAASEEALVSDSYYDLASVAAAKVAWLQLHDHIKTNVDHYAQAVWLSRIADSRDAEMQSNYWASLVETEPIAFYGDKVALRIVHLEDASRLLGLDLESIVDAADNLEEPHDQSIVTLPVAATVMESRVGECNSCEEYIRESRRIELIRVDAVASQQRSEAARRTMRLEQDPPLLDPFEPLESDDSDS